VPAPAPS